MTSSTHSHGVKFKQTEIIAMQSTCNYAMPACSNVIPGPGKSRSHCRGNIVARCADTRNISEVFQKHVLCPPQMLRAWQNVSTFGKRAHAVSNVAVTNPRRFAAGQIACVNGPLRSYPALCRACEL